MHRIFSSLLQTLQHEVLPIHKHDTRPSQPPIPPSSSFPQFPRLHFHLQEQDIQSPLMQRIHPHF